jgi:hypothetical protein
MQLSQSHHLNVAARLRMQVARRASSYAEADFVSSNNVGVTGLNHAGFAGLPWSGKIYKAARFL